MTNNHILRLMESKAPVSVFLTSGIRLQGVITDFDDSAIMITKGRKEQLVLASGILTISTDDNKKDGNKTK